MSQRATHRLTFGACAVLFAVTAVLMATSGPSGAQVPPQFPKAAYAPLGDGQTRVWFTPGNLHDSEPQAVLMGRRGEPTTQMERRRDGVWVAEVATPKRWQKHTFYFTVGATTETWGAWVKAKKVRP